jgi:hypothetical protein
MPKILNTMVKDNASYANLIRYANTVGYSRPPLTREFDIYAALAKELSPAWVGQRSTADAAKRADRAMARLIR